VAPPRRILHRCGLAIVLLVTAHVIAEGNIQSDGMGAFHQRIDVETEKIEADNKTTEGHIGVRLNIYSQAKHADAQTTETSAMQLFHYGQRIKFATTFNSPRNFRNPGAFDYAGYLRDHRVAATASTKYAGIELLPGFTGSRIELCRAHVHRSVIQKIHALWPERLAILMDAIVIGEESFIDRPRAWTSSDQERITYSSSRG
jgi:predicted membrane metal-binding protein